MPHISIEYSANVADHYDIDALVLAVHEAALADGLPPLAGLRTRATPRQSYRIADGQSTHGFIAILIRIGPGRDAVAKKRFLTAVLDAAEAHVTAEAAEAAEPETQASERSSAERSSAELSSAERAKSERAKSERANPSPTSPLALAWSVELQEIDPEFRINRNYVADHINTNTQG